MEIGGKLWGRIRLMAIPKCWPFCDTWEDPTGWELLVMGPNTPQDCRGKRETTLFKLDGAEVPDVLSEALDLSSTWMLKPVHLLVLLGFYFLADEKSQNVDLNKQFTQWNIPCVGEDEFSISMKQFASIQVSKERKSKVCHSFQWHTSNPSSKPKLLCAPRCGHVTANTTLVLPEQLSDAHFANGLQT
ncbi:N(6)-Adenine-Specific Methyltransferase Mettl4 [Manis pentadactyla]|nr:N(6)-Adenine-Specific Methyltransferase Mettl4 [Manis pentadactyla]